MLVPSIRIASMLGVAAVCGCTDDVVGVYPQLDAGDGPMRDADATRADRARADPAVPESSTAPDTGSGCAFVDARPEYSLPTVWIVSPARNERYSYQPVDDQLFRSSPVNSVERLQASAAFGVIFHGGDTNVEDCAQLTIVEPALNNFGAIADAFTAVTAQPHSLWRRPVTTFAYEHIQKRLAESGARPSSIAIVFDQWSQFSTNACGEESASGLDVEKHAAAQAELRSQISELASVGLLTYLFIPQVDGNNTVAHELAALGGADIIFYSQPMYDAQGNQIGSTLAQALETVVRRAVSCEISMQGAVSGEDVCSGRVLIGDRVVPCDDSDGYRLKDERTIEIVGQSCEYLRDHPTAHIRAEFPCDVIVLI